MQTEAQTTLSQPDVTGESFAGTIGIFDMTVLPDPTVHGRTSTCPPVSTTRRRRTPARRPGRVIPDTTPPDQHYYRFTDQLAKDCQRATGKSISDLPPDLLSAGEGVQAVKRQIAVAICRSWPHGLATPALAAAPASAGNGPSSVGCSTGDCCTAMLQKMVTFGGP